MYTIKISRNSSKDNYGATILRECTEVEYEFFPNDKDRQTFFKEQFDSLPNCEIYGNYEEFKKKEKSDLIRLIYRNNKDGHFHYLFIMDARIYIMQNGKTIESIYVE